MTHAPSFAVPGFRPHTYWTAAVALAGPLGAPRVIERRRVVFADGDERFVHHQAAEGDPAEAVAMIERVRSATEANAAACAAVGPDARRVLERDLPAQVSRRLQVDEGILQAQLKQIGAALGPPWSEDQKLSTLAAWLHLEGQKLH